MPHQVQESPLPGAIPRYELPGWRERFGVVAGVTGRGFDLGLWSALPVGEVMQRWRSLRRAEPGFHATILGTQVHGAEVRWHREATGWVQIDGVDGHATATPGLLLTVTVADCIPIYLVDPVRRAIGLLHSGWRGTAAGILGRGVEQLVDAAGSSVSDIIMHAGVGICGDCYEVGSEVMAGCGLRAEGPGPWQMDLREVLVKQAERLGLRNISTSAWCSGHDRERFYSHRASGGSDGRMVAYLGILGLPAGAQSEPQKAD